MQAKLRRPLCAIPLLASLSLFATGCATSADPLTEGNPTVADIESAQRPHHGAPPSADRQAILSMVGEFGVTFAFDETVPLAEGYETRDPKRSGAAEVVILVEDAGDRIVLQHLLLMGTSGVIKHWRQDWVWQADSRFEFSDDQTWTVVPLAEDQVRGTWTQCVYEVSDAPRYCGTGDWNHRYGNATWTSDRTWRPLPRREYTTREDYTALNAQNRHTITPTGWTHEQDNSKVVRVDGETREVLVREFGFNHYVRTDRSNFSPAYDYWDDTAAFWQQVRQDWSERLRSGAIVLDTDVDGMPIIDGLFDLADAVRDGETITSEQIDGVFDQYVIRQGTRVANQ